MNNKEIAELLREIAAAYTIKGENRFKIIAYDNAADSISNLTYDLQDLWKEGKLKEVAGIGQSIASYIDQLYSKGSVSHFNQIKKGLPKAMFTFLKLPGFGAKKAYKLATLLNIKDNQDPLLELKKAAEEHKIAKLEGFGEKSEQDVIESISGFKKKEAKLTRMLLNYASEIAFRVIAYLKTSKDVLNCYPLGSLRRKAATVGDIDIAVASNNPKGVIEHFTKFAETKRIIEKGDVSSSILLKNNVQVDIMIEGHNAFGALLQHFTGSKNHNIKLREYALKKNLSLSEHGIKKVKSQKSKVKSFASEEDFYNYLGLEWIAPELREDTGEIEASLSGKLPALVELKDIKGDLHLHSNYDLKPSHDLGSNTFNEIMDKAQKLGYEYISFSEHNPRLSNNSEKEIIDIMKRRKDTIDKLNYSIKSTRVQIFNMLEIDILPNGKLALPDKAFEYIDAGLVSVHSSFTLSKAEMTQRVLSALSHPKVKVFAHPTTRLIEKRDSIDLDWEKIFAKCKDSNIALEINASPYRLDLPDTLVREGLKYGVRYVINTDTHQLPEMDLMQYGVSVARRGWAEKKDIINTMGYNEIKKWLVGR